MGSAEIPRLQCIQHPTLVQNANYVFSVSRAEWELWFWHMLNINCTQKHHKSSFLANTDNQQKGQCFSELVADVTLSNSVCYEF